MKDRPAKKKKKNNSKWIMSFVGHKHHNDEVNKTVKSAKLLYV